MSYVDLEYPKYPIRAKEAVFKVHYFQKSDISECTTDLHYVIQPATEGQPRNWVSVAFPIDRLS